MSNDQRELFIEKICDQIINEMPLVELKNIVWGHMLEELHTLSESDLELYAQDYGVEL
jgi:hypothetical protein